jgi:hypothetical protein
MTIPHRHPLITTPRHRRPLITTPHHRRLPITIPHHRHSPKADELIAPSVVLGIPV